MGKSQLSSDLDALDSHLDELFKQSSEKKVLMLESKEDREKLISGEQNNILRGLGFNSLQNIQEYEENCRNLNKIGLTMQIINELKKIKDTYGKPIISYSNLVTLCKKHNLYFGSSELFIGKMPMSNVVEIQHFNLDAFSSHYSVLQSYERQSIVAKYVASSAKAMIVAPLNEFILKNVFIASSRELIKFPDNDSYCKAPFSVDPIVIVPFALRDCDEIFFIILTHWDNSKSII